MQLIKDLEGLVMKYTIGMKKILIAFIFITIPLFVLAQLSGSGTFASPYKGTLNQDVTWSSDVYINGDILTSAYRLTIDPGVKVIFVTDTADIKIRGTGRLVADGTSSGTIRFTADDDNDGNYGETGERWGHISFESMGAAGASLIDNCIIEFGDVSSTLLTPVNPNQYGGAVHTDFSNLTISNCEIRNCKAGWGGAIFVSNGKNPSLSNCYIHDNISTTSGGGLYFWTNSYSTVTNCIVSYNSCTGLGGGGGIFIGGQAKDVTIINSVISNNSASQQSYGHNIRFNNNTNTPKPKFINSIIWSPANSIVYLSGGSPLVTDFEFCAIETPPITYTNCITLNALNTNPAGPNFVDPVLPGLDWSILYVSPCRDAGTTSVATTDYIGNGRVWTYDIGAYEYQYCRWKTTASSADWTTAANWDGGVPTSARDVVIPTGATNYPTGSTSQDFTLGAGKQMIIEQGACVTLNNLTNNGTLKLNATSAGFASLIVNSYSKGGGATEEIQLFLTGGGTKTPLTYKWHYISSPVTSLAVSTFSPGVTLDLAQWIEPRPATSLSQGWVAYDGYIYSTGGMGGPTFSTLIPGKGYDYYKSSDYTFTFGGQLNTGDVNASLSYKTGNDNLWGYNLIGNPFTSGLDWDYIISHSFPSNTTKSLYFTRNSVLCTYINGVGVPGDVNGIIPPMQGFFSKTYSSGNTIILAAAARTHTNIHSRYKGSQTIPLVRLSLTDDTLSDETVVRFDDQAKSYLDNDFDAIKMFLSPDLASIYSSMAGIDYAINGLPFPDTLTEVPLTVNITADTTLHTITATQIQGLDQYDVFLFDKIYNDSFNLRITPSVTFSASKGTITGRFILKVGTITTGIENPVVSRNSFNIYPANSYINIQTLADEWDGKAGSVNIFDITGKTVSNLLKTAFWKNSLTQVEAPVSKGIYIVELKSGMMRYVGKVIIR